MGTWDGMQNAQTFERGTFLDDGRYDLRIRRCLDKMTRKSGQAFIVEAEVIASSNPKHAIGTTVTWFQKMADRDVAFGAISEFIAAVYGKDLRVKAEKEAFERDIKPSTPGIMNAATDENQNFLAGKMVSVEVQKVKTQKGFDFSKHNWEPAGRRTIAVSPPAPVAVAAPPAAYPAAPAAFPAPAAPPAAPLPPPLGWPQR